MFLLYAVTRPDDLGKISNHYDMGEVNYSLSSQTNSFQAGLGKLFVLYNTVLFSVINGTISSIMLDCYPNRKVLEKPQTVTAGRSSPSVP